MIFLSEKSFYDHRYCTSKFLSCVGAFSNIECTNANAMHWFLYDPHKKHFLHMFLEAIYM